MRVVVGAVGVTAAAVLMFALGQTDALHDRFGLLILGFWVVALATTWKVTRRAGPWRRPVLAVVLASAVVQLPGILIDPRTSSDAYRYVWDGRVQLSGTSPYRYAPLDDRLARLRDPLLFPGLAPGDRSGFTTAPLPRDRAALLRLARDDPRTRINRPRVPTIYPPAAQAWFTAVAAVTPRSLGTRGLQVGSAAIAVLIAGALAHWRRRRGDDPLGALWWAWCPVAVIEAGNGAHVDIVATTFVLAALWVFTAGALPRHVVRRGALAAGALLGLAASVKLTPLALLPAVAPWRGRTVPARLRSAVTPPAAAVATLLVTYLPHVLVAGALVIGYLPGYLSEEGGAARAAVLGLVLPASWLGPAVVVVMVATAVSVMRRTGQTLDPVVAALVMFGVLLISTTPGYPWYAIPLVALAVLTGRLEWLAVAVAGYLSYGATTTPPVAGLAYAAATLVAVGVTVARHRPSPLSQRVRRGRPSALGEERAG